MSMQITHRQDITIENYKGIPIHAAPGLHEELFNIVDHEIGKSSGIVLDIAAGSGAFSQKLLDNNYSVIANELFINKLTWKADKKIPIFQVNLNGDFSDIFAEKRINHIVAIEVIEHLENPESFIKSCYETIPDGGKIIISTPNIHNFYSIYKFITKGEFFLFNYDYFFSTGHKKIIPIWLFDAMLKNLGIENYSIKPIAKFKNLPITQKVFSKIIGIFIRKKQRINLDSYCICVVITK